MRNIITVMNAKGGVGKSTLVLALAETLSAHHGKRILVIDSDAHSSISHMLMSPIQLGAVQAEGRTIVDYFVETVLKASQANWVDFLVSSVSDVDDARSIDLLPSGGHLTLFEREVSRGERELLLRKVIRLFLGEARRHYDFVLVDSAPGLSVLTECWLREADFYLSPTKPDYISTHGLQFLGEFRDRDPDMGFAEHLGVVINMKDQHSFTDEQFDRWLRRNGKYRCFDQVILRATALQAAAHFCPCPTGQSTPDRPARVCGNSPSKCSIASDRFKGTAPDPAGDIADIRLRGSRPEGRWNKHKPLSLSLTSTRNCDSGTRQFRRTQVDLLSSSFEKMTFSLLVLGPGVPILRRCRPV